MHTEMGYQLSSIAPYLQTETDLRRSMKKIAHLGYRYVQLQSVSMDISDAVIAEALQENGLQCVAVQEDYILGFGDDPDRRIARALACGAAYLVFALIPWDIDTPEKLADFAEQVHVVRKKVQDAGLVFAFHPIGPDYRQIDGVPVYERLMELLGPTVQLTFCVSACFNSAVTWEDVFEKYAGRMDLVHFKDYRTLPDGAKSLMPLGAGEHDWVPILAAAKQAGVRYIFAEQEKWEKDAFDCAAESYVYLKNLGL